MNWTTPAELRAALARRWDRGDLLRAMVSGAPIFPLRLNLKGPDSADLLDRFEAVRHWIAGLATQPHLRVEWRELRHRVHGAQRLPAEVWVDTLDDALAWLGKRRDARRLRDLVALTRADLPVLEPWLAQRPLQALALADDWSRLLAVVRWVIEHPRPDVYLRQVDVPGVHSKFIEAHRAVLTELLDLALPGSAIVRDCTGAARFAARYGFRDKPSRVRFRVLDADLALLPGGVRLPDLTLDADSFASLDLAVGTVFITENEVNFLAFPPVRSALVVFGAGYGWDALARARWLARSRLWYWGDIDTHGFAILDQLRGHFDGVDSFLMDRPTLLGHAEVWGDEPDPVRHDLARLTVDERVLFDDLRHDRIRPRLRLEQERIGFGWLTAALASRPQ